MEKGVADPSFSRKETVILQKCEFFPLPVKKVFHCPGKFVTLKAVHTVKMESDMKKLSLIPTISIAAATALVIGVGLFTSTPAKAIPCFFCANGSNACGVTYTAACGSEGCIATCQQKKSCSGTTPIVESGSDLCNNNKCRSCQSDSECGSGKVCMGNGSCQTKASCGSSNPIYVSSNNTCRAVQNSSECTSYCPSCVWVN